jgi:LL-diaminopimelate aminotransferase
MLQCNENYLKLQGRYLFREIAKRIDDFQKKNPKNEIIKLGIGDVTLPLTSSVIKAMHNAVDEMSDAEAFKGYGPEQGYDFLREAIVKHDYSSHGIFIEKDEIFISDGSKCDTANILDIFALGNKVALTDPVYPVYVDTNVMLGRTGHLDAEGKYEGIYYLPCTEENGFMPAIPPWKVDIIYLCYPNNPTGTTLTRKQLKQWVDYARENKSVILFDAAYESYIREPRIPHSIYEIEGARECAIEFRSFSKNAGFTGLRCAFTVVPKDISVLTTEGRKQSLNQLWNRRQTTKFNGVSYITQRAAAAVYSDSGMDETKGLVNYYLENADLIRDTLSEIGLSVYGGINAPYIWVKTPNNMGSWDYFQKVLDDMNIVVTPGSGFGASGEGFVRFSAFNSHENVKKAMQRFQEHGV